LRDGYEYFYGVIKTFLSDNVLPFSFLLITSFKGMVHLVFICKFWDSY